MLETKTYSGSFSGVPTKISLNTVSVERGMSWISAVDVAMDHDAADEGFYISKLVTSHISHLFLTVFGFVQPITFFWSFYR